MRDDGDSRRQLKRAFELSPRDIDGARRADDAADAGLMGGDEIL